MFAASCPNSLSLCFHPTVAWIFRFESRLRRTSNGWPGFMSEALMKSAP